MTNYVANFLVLKRNTIDMLGQLETGSLWSLGSLTMGELTKRSRLSITSQFNYIVDL